MRLARCVHSPFAYGKRFKAPLPKLRGGRRNQRAGPAHYSGRQNLVRRPSADAGAESGLRQTLAQPAAEVRHPRLPMAAEMAQTLTRSRLTLRRGCHSGVKTGGRDDGACLVTTSGR
jgi:hypothetical protein